MRVSLLAVVMFALPALAAAQGTAPTAGGVVPLPPIGLPLPQIGLPHPPTGLPVARSPQAPQPGGRQGPRARRPQHPVPYFVPVYVWPYPNETAATSGVPDSSREALARRTPNPAGYLMLDVAAAGDAQLFVDGFYVGTLTDSNGGVALEPGAHAVDIRGAGFEPLSVAVNIEAGRTIAYRGTLKSIAASPAPDPLAAATSQPGVPAAPMTGYIVPGCYIGNVPPQDAGLPASCDVSRVITIRR
jgi:hypothetical protein